MRLGFFAAALALLIVLPGAGAIALPAAHNSAPTLAPGKAANEAQPEEGAQIVDAAGDAVEPIGQEAAYDATSACGATLDVPGQQPPSPNLACSAAGDAGAAATANATEPASPGFDILSAKLVETPESLVVRLRVASLTETDFGGAWRDRDITNFDVCWKGRFECSVGAEAWMGTGPDGKLAIQSFYLDISEGACAQSCSWAVPLKVTYGSPGILEWSIPRALPDLGEGTTLLSIEADTVIFHGTLDSATPGLFADATYANADVHQGSSNGLFTFDTAKNGSSFTLRDAPSNAPLPTLRSMPGAAILYDGYPQKRALDPRAALLNMEMSDNDTSLTLSSERGQVDPEGSAPSTTPVATSNEHWFYHISLITLPNGSILFLGDAPRTNGTYMRFAATSADWFGNQTMHVIPSTVTVTTGSPGWVNISVLKSDIGYPKKGELLGGVNSALNPLRYDARQTESFTFVQKTDQTGPGSNVIAMAPWRFTHDSPAKGAGSKRASDPLGDATLPPGVAGSAATFDITALEVRGTGPTETRLTMTLADLHQVNVPTGYKGILYAFGIETDQGSYMAGYYKQPATAASPGSQDYFCSQDVDVLSQVKHDPQDAVWIQKITGVILNAADEGAQGGGASPGSITLIVPHACVGVSTEGPLHVKRVEAGTYLISDAGATAATPAATEIDHAEAGQDIIMGAAAVLPPPAPFWLAPFGIDQFWNIAGVATALGGGLIAFSTRQRRRNALAREMRAIDAAHHKLREDAVAWKAAMTAARSRAAENLRRGKLRPDELLVIERRIELLGVDIIHAKPAPQSVQTGTVLFERYRLVSLLGEGGQGRAWLAHDETIHRQVVVKMLSTGGLDTNAKRLLLAEARLAGGISHPNVVGVLDVRESGDQAFLILEYVEGGSLRGLLSRRGQLPTREAVVIYRGMLAGLDAAHERGVVHRDVKPENVLIAKDGTAKIADFGAARDSRPNATMQAQAAGTLAYMSPEQARGAPVDARSDLYSAAAVLVEMLTGAMYLPLEGADEFQARALILERAPELRLPDDALLLSAPLLRSLAKKPADRYQDAKECLAAIDAAIWS